MLSDLAISSLQSPASGPKSQPANLLTFSRWDGESARATADLQDNIGLFRRDKKEKSPRSASVAGVGCSSYCFAHSS